MTGRAISRPRYWDAEFEAHARFISTRNWHWLDRLALIVQARKRWDGQQKVAA